MKNNNIAVVGLGYVGLPLAVLLSSKFNVKGFDINKERIDELNNFNDSTLEISSEKLRESFIKNLSLTQNLEKIKDCNIYIITVPTPINKDKTPNLKPLLNASKSIGSILSVDDIVIYESTVFPGCTEEKCVPVLETESKLKFNTDFYCGYSPERINPGDKKHTIDKIVKVTSGSTPETANKVDKIYASVISAGTHKASSIKIAEAAKVIENAQRDINIAFVNELAKIFNKMNIDTHEVLNAASTKWNFLNFKPGLVGGHCIGVDPYYLADKSIKLGYKPNIILSGRKLNDEMGDYVADKLISILKSKNKFIEKTKILILGVTFKENCPDFRNTKVIDIIKRLKHFNMDVEAYDPWVNKDLFEREYNLKITKNITNKKYNAIILAVSHSEFKNLDIDKLKLNNQTIVYDLKGFFETKKVTNRL